MQLFLDYGLPPRPPSKRWKAVHLQFQNLSQQNPSFSEPQSIGSSTGGVDGATSGSRGSASLLMVPVLDNADLAIVSASHLRKSSNSS